MTPHIGGATHETLLQGAEMIAAEIARFARGEPLLNVYNPSVVTVRAPRRCFLPSMWEPAAAAQSYSMSTGT